MEIVVFELEEWERTAFEGLADQQSVRYADEELDRGNAQQFRDAEIISPFIYSDLDADVLRRFDNLQMIATRSTGFDHIDLDYCNEHEIVVSNVPSYGENTVAEHTFGLLLTISHRLREATDRTRRGDFSLKGLQGFDLRGKTLGVIGTGNIGRYVIEIAKGFQMEVLAHDVVQDDELAARLDFRYVDLETLLGQADVVTLHVPANPQTRHLLSQDEFAKMKDGAILLNTARGDVVNNQALLQALADGKVAAAGLDVLPEEPVIREEAELLRSVFREEHNLESLLTDHILMRMRNVVITPHSAFYTREAVGRILETTVANIQGFMQGEPQHVVNGE